MRFPGDEIQDTCLNCGKELPDDGSGDVFCNDTCESAYAEYVRNEAAMYRHFRELRAAGLIGDDDGPF